MYKHYKLTNFEPLDELIYDIFNYNSTNYNYSSVKYQITESEEGKTYLIPSIGLTKEDIKVISKGDSLLISVGVDEKRLFNRLGFELIVNDNELSYNKDINITLKNGILEIFIPFKDKPKELEIKIK